MMDKEEFIRSMKKIVFVFVAINLYFIVCLFKGQNTIINYFKYKNEIRENSVKRDEIVSSRQQLENIVQLISKKEVDLDTLDELSRRLAQLSLSGEKMVILDDTDTDQSER